MSWLGYDWGEHLYYASDYFEQLYEWAESLIEAGKAYVDDLTAEEIRAHRGTLTEPGDAEPLARPPGRGEPRPLPRHARRRVRRRRPGPAGERSTWHRATSTCAIPSSTGSSTPTTRAPAISWCIYPTYDFAHGQSDAIEHITHSLCTLEFEAHRPLYDWFLENLPTPSKPRQIEFARFNLTYTVLSKRRLLQLVQGGHVTGWDDPRMPTLSGCDGSVIRRPRFASVSTAPASPNARAWSTWPFSNTVCVPSSTARPSAGWVSCARSRW